MITVFLKSKLPTWAQKSTTEVNKCTASEPITSVEDKEWEVGGGCSWARRCSTAYIWFTKKVKLEKKNQCYDNTLSVVG